MKKPRRPYSLRGEFVVVTREKDGAWYPAVGANTEAAARVKAREYRHHTYGTNILVVSNAVGAAPHAEA